MPYVNFVHSLIREIEEKVIFESTHKPVKLVYWHKMRRSIKPKRQALLSAD